MFFCMSVASILRGYNKANYEDRSKALFLRASKIKEIQHHFSISNIRLFRTSSGQVVDSTRSRFGFIFR